jgi:AraC-like DNA-binding protein
VNPGEVHDGRAIGGQPRSWRMLYFDPTLMNELRADISDCANAPLTFAAPVYADESLRRLFHDAFAHATASVGSRDTEECEVAILRLAARAQANSIIRRQSSNKPTPSIRRVRERIDADPSSAHLTLVGLAGEVGLSRYQLLRGFARELGLTPHAYVLQQRIALARRLIRAGQNLAELAINAGFCDQSHLTRCFVKQFGVTPSRYACAAE